MPSLPLSKLLPGGSSKAPASSEKRAFKDTPKRPRSGWSASTSKRQAEKDLESPSLPPPPPIDTLGSHNRSDSFNNSYFSHQKRRDLTPSSFYFNDTDDYGFPLADRPSDTSPSPRLGERCPQDSERYLTVRCVTCDKPAQVNAGSITWRCDQCRTFNPITPLPFAHEFGYHGVPIKKPVSVSRMTELLEKTIADYIKMQEQRRAEIRDEKLDEPSIGPHSLAEAAGPVGHLPAVSTSLKPVPPPWEQRRGSAPNASSSSFNLFPQEPPKKSKRRHRPGPLTLSGNTVDHGGRLPSPGPKSAPRYGNHPSPRLPSDPFRPKTRVDPIRFFFRPVIEMIAESYGKINCLNVSFSTIRRHVPIRSYTEELSRPQRPELRENRTLEHKAFGTVAKISQMDHKDFMIGDVYDVASSLVADLSPGCNLAPKKQHTNADAGLPKLVNHASPHMDWKNLHKWYDLVLSIGLNGKGDRFSCTVENAADDGTKTSNAGNENDLVEIGLFLRNAILDITENMLTSSGLNPAEPQDTRYLLVLLANPLLKTPDEYPLRPTSSGRDMVFKRSRRQTLPALLTLSPSDLSSSPPRNIPLGQWNPSSRSRNLSLILGAMAKLPHECHQYLTVWFSRYPAEEFRLEVDMILRFINERVSLRRLRPPSPHKGQNPKRFNGLPINSSLFDDALNANVVELNRDGNLDDWQLRAACKVMQMFVRANYIHYTRSPTAAASIGGQFPPVRKPTVKQLLPTDHFYISQLDSNERFNLRDDFDAWGRKSTEFTFCQYPFLLSLGTKIKILEYDARRKMADKARQEFFDALLRHMNAEKFFHLNVRRTCLIEDSLQRISEAISSSQEEAKKALRIHFEGEEGLDAGGLRKEWFLMLVRELFDPRVGLFLYNDESNFCYFNPNTLESSEQYQLVGAVLGLAIYNSTILDVPFPPFLFKKLVSAAPASSTDNQQNWKLSWRPTLSDLAEYQPDLARGLKQLLDFEGDVEDSYGWSFAVPAEKYGEVSYVPLMEGGENRPITKKNREEFVDLYVEHLLNTSVKRQFEPLCRGFWRVCSSNALTLFRGEEIELLIRGSGELDFSVLRGTAVYENWKESEDREAIDDPEKVEKRFPVIKWFWDLMDMADRKDQQRVLRWITGSDRIPATGAANLVINIQCLGGDCERLPQARTCFNMIQLWNYSTRRSFIQKFWYAVVESEGFGMK